MKKVITYGTYDLLHIGHINLLKRAKKLGDYLIVGVTTENYDIQRGKLNVQQDLMTRIENVKALGIADEVIPEEYEGQKIDDIKHYDVDVFVIGSDWVGYFDYLNEYCEVVYLPRTEGVSSTDLRKNDQFIRLGILGQGEVVNKFISETEAISNIDVVLQRVELFNDEDFNEFDAAYVRVHPNDRLTIIDKLISKGKHVITDPLYFINSKTLNRLYKKAEKNDTILFDSLRTDFLTAFNRIVVLLKSGIIGDIKSVDVNCTSMKHNDDWILEKDVGSLKYWGPVGLLPVFRLLGTNYNNATITQLRGTNDVDIFTNGVLHYNNAIANINVGVGVKSESDLIVAGTKGYLYVPSPWWKTSYFEVRYEDKNQNRRYFYKFDGEGYRYQISQFMRSIRDKNKSIELINFSLFISDFFEKFDCDKFDIKIIK